MNFTPLLELAGAGKIESLTAIMTPPEPRFPDVE